MNIPLPTRIINLKENILFKELQILCTILDDEYVNICNFLHNLKKYLYNFFSVFLISIY